MNIKISNDGIDDNFVILDLDLFTKEELLTICKIVTETESYGTLDDGSQDKIKNYCDYHGYEAI